MFEEDTSAADVEDDDTAPEPSHLLQNPKSIVNIHFILGVYRANRLINFTNISMHMVQPHNYCCKITPDWI